MKVAKPWGRRRIHLIHWNVFQNIKQAREKWTSLIMRFKTQNTSWILDLVLKLLACVTSFTRSIETKQCLQATVWQVFLYRFPYANLFKWILLIHTNTHTITNFTEPQNFVVHLNASNGTKPMKYFVKFKNKNCTICWFAEIKNH